MNMHAKNFLIEFEGLLKRADLEDPVQGSPEVLLSHPYSN